MSEPSEALKFNKKHLKLLLILQIICFLVAIVFGTIAVLHQNPWAASLGHVFSLLVGLLLGLEHGPEFLQRLTDASK